MARACAGRVGLSENVQVAPNILTKRHGRPHLFKAENVFAVFSAVEFVEVFLVDIQCRTIALPVTGRLIIRKLKESDKDAPSGEPHALTSGSSGCYLRTSNRSALSSCLRASSS